MNTASRMESTSSHGGVHVSSAAWAQTGLPGALAEQRTLSVKGKEVPMDTFLLFHGTPAAADARAQLEGAISVADAEAAEAEAVEAWAAAGGGF